MAGTVVAIYQSASVAEMALTDLLAAKVPSAVIKRVVKVSAHDPQRHIVASGVAVTVEEKDASVVKEIMDMHGPVAIEEPTSLRRAA